ncbi:MAG: SEL1-like repeat protein [Alphaproteobacteria bacterium]|nr:SEL1-like repeat protein [Alphaproteobacteria bacterium]
MNNETFTPKNTIKALQQQARAGDATAQYELARRLIEGDGIEQDFGDGSDWFREAAIQGMANAQYNLGVLYERGLGVTKDDVRALLWYHSAAEQSHPLAQYNLGIFYLQGRGIPLSYAEAVRWFRAASDQGVAKATYNLAVLTEDGLGVRPDKSKAMELYEKGASAGHHEASNRLTLLRDPNTGKTKPGTFEDTANTQGEGGSTGTTVADIQAVLRRDGIYSGRIDGVAGPKTRTAIQEYQRRNALPITGIPSILLLDYMKTSKTNAHSEGPDSG